MKTIVTLYFYLFFALSASGQTVVCLVRSDTVFAGTTDKSKINSIGKFNFVFAGPLDTIATRELSRIATISAHFNEFHDSSIHTLKKIFNALFSNTHDQDSNFFNKQVLEYGVTRAISKVCFFGYEKGKPVLINISFYLNKRIKHPVVISYGEDLSPFAVFSGPPSVRKGAVGFPRNFGGADEVQSTIRIVSNNDGPIDILIITRKRSAWIRK